MNRMLKGESFTSEVIKANGLAVVQFKAEWNGWCQVIAPIYEELSKKYSAKAKFFTIDIDEESSIAREYRIADLPTILIFDSGELIDHATGLTAKNVIVAKIEDAIAH